ncbi:hypothetical protein FRC09_008143 [Ceratobasidium sp. 395]|nr:hypothetical protein FRC09_008143 [Ceratobasidium sp. 395]
MKSHSVFTTAELVYIILSHLSVSECVEILTVNAIFFRQGVKIVWGELSSPAPLFALFCRQKLEIMPSGYRNTEIIVPPKVNPKRWQSSRKYAACVRKVTNLREAFHHQTVHWSGLGGPSVIRRAPLAANVRVIEVSWTDSPTRTTNVSNLVKLLLGPATSTLRCHGNCVPGLSVQGAKGVLERAQTAGSRLTDLMLRTENPEDEEVVVALALLIRDFELLVSVDLSKELVTGPMLDCMHDLPNLERLVLAVPSEHAEVSLWNHLASEDDWVGQPFPSLRSLSFHDSPCSAVHILLSARHSFLHGITQLYVQISSRDFGRLSAWLNSFASLAELIVSEASRLDDLTIVPPHNPDGPWRLSLELLSRLFSLNLRRLALHNVRLPLASPGLDLIDGKWPSLSHLAIPYQHVRPNTLLRLAKRGALQHLRVEVQAPQPGEELLADEMRVNDPTAPMQLEGQFDMEKASEHTIETMARLLLQCWPNVSLVWRNRVEHRAFEEPSRAAYIALLAKIRELRDGDS